MKNISAIYLLLSKFPVKKLSGRSQKLVFVLLTSILFPLGLVSTFTPEAQAQQIRIVPNNTGGTPADNGGADDLTSIAIGNAATVPTNGNDQFFSTAIGNGANAGFSATALGTGATATGNFSTATGNGALASGSGATASGTGSRATATNASATGNSAEANNTIGNSYW